MISRAHGATSPVAGSMQVSRSTPPIRRPSRRSWNSIPIPPVPNGLSSVLSTISASRRVPQVSGLSACASFRPGPYGSLVGFGSSGLRSCVCHATHTGMGVRWSSVIACMAFTTHLPPPALSRRCARAKPTACRSARRSSDGGCRGSPARGRTGDPHGPGIPPRCRATGMAVVERRPMCPGVAAASRCQSAGPTRGRAT